jgi:hypothetical protein
MMKNSKIGKQIILSILLIMLTQNIYAQVGAEDPGIHYNQETASKHGGKIKIKEIKEFILTADTAMTGMDEYLRRRRQLKTKVILSPVSTFLGALGSLYIGAGAGAGIAIINSVDGHDYIGYAIIGAATGFITGAVVFTIDAASGVIRYHDNELILKALAEYHMKRKGTKMAQLYKKVTKDLINPPSLEEFQSYLIKLDKSGELIDGSLVHKPAIRIGSRLKYKVARPKDIKRKIYSTTKNKGDL